MFAELCLNYSGASSFIANVNLLMRENLVMTSAFARRSARIAGWHIVEFAREETGNPRLEVCVCRGETLTSSLRDTQWSIYKTSGDVAKFLLFP